MDERISEWMDGQVMNIMPPASLDSRLVMVSKVNVRQCYHMFR